MVEKTPETRWERSAVGGKTAASVGGNLIRYMAARPFLSKDKKLLAKKHLDVDNAKAIFKGLSLLKGTALKIAQTLSMETDFIPDEIRKELEKSYNQVPPLNRALVRKAVINAFGKGPETVFNTMELTSFAAASLGQVHLGEGRNREKIAIKVQYPGIGATIKSDMLMIKQLLRPLSDYKLILPTLTEIEKRLFEEIDYNQEAEAMERFKSSLDIPDVIIPRVFRQWSAGTVLTTRYIPGLSLDLWLATNPGQAERDRVAGILNSIFLRGFYGLGCIHADPNPGNFIITADLQVGLIDFGCVKAFDPSFVDCYKKLISIMINLDKTRYFEIFQELRIISPDLDSRTKKELMPLLDEVMAWYAKLYQDDLFDFGEHRSFINHGKQLMYQLMNYRSNFRPNPAFVFLDRTRYGLFRLFEKLKARVAMKNSWENGC